MIVKTSTGIRHVADKGFYSGAIHESGVTPVVVKRGRGRPRKDTGDTGATYEFGRVTKALAGWTV